MLGDFASLDVQNTYRGSDAYGFILVMTRLIIWLKLRRCLIAALTWASLLCLVAAVAARAVIKFSSVVKATPV
ncbi:hypothetical protein [Piscirickettsia salmonis]|uniref:hypothetical protein n=1 Tax=Piscirickettsia salmonis TaxID=1238 RepID=UPI001E3DFC8C|nr:hypothetical protein [Piscirickettsia salmonis]